MHMFAELIMFLLPHLIYTNLIKQLMHMLDGGILIGIYRKHLILQLQQMLMWCQTLWSQEILILRWHC